MGEIAEMMLEGTLCQGCGEYLENGDGYSRYCVSCKNDCPDYYLDGDATTTKDGKSIYRPTKTNCPYCNKLVKKVGLRQHIRAKHNV